MYASSVAFVRRVDHSSFILSCNLIGQIENKSRYVTEILLRLGYADVIFRWRESRQLEIRLRSQASSRFEVFIGDRRHLYSPGGSGELDQSNLEDWERAKTVHDVPDSPNLSFHMSGMIADHRRNLGHVNKIETLPIFPICLQPSQMIADVYNFQFSLIMKVWDGQETVKFLTVWDFPNI